jgi:pimeloyl-ACP methyl ester carboxylesterase
MMRRRRLAVAVVLLAVAAFFYFAVPVAKSGANFIVWKLTSGSCSSSGYATNGDVRIHYSVYGDGPPLVLLHGGLSSNIDWIGEIPALSRHYRLILINLRGHGRSSLGAEPFTYRLLAADVLSVLDELRIATTDIVGWSDGGNTGILFAIEYPQRIRRLVAISANFHPQGIAAEMHDTIRNAPEDIDPAIGRWLYRWQSAAPAQWSQLRDRVITMWRGYPQLSQEDLGAVRAPTLLIVGAEDDIEMSHALAMVAAIPNAELVVIPEVGHAVPHDAPDTLVRNIERFLVAD